MNFMELHETVNKLIGPTDPTGSHILDVQRKLNLAVKVALVHELVAEIHELSEDKNNYVASVAAIGKDADEALKSLADYFPSTHTKE